MKIAVVLIFASSLVVSAECLEREDKCLSGGKHKDSPSAEESMVVRKRFLLYERFHQTTSRHPGQEDRHFFLDSKQQNIEPQV